MASGTASLTRRTFAVGLAVAGTSLLAVSGCSLSPIAAPTSQSGGSEAGADEKREEERILEGGTFRCQTGPLTRIDPHGAVGYWDSRVAGCLYDALTVYDYKLDMLVGKAASSWESSDDCREFVFHLREGASFHNGEPVTSGSFARAWDLLCRPTAPGKAPSPVASRFAMVAGFDEVAAGVADSGLDVECPDDYTLVVNLSTAFPNFPFIVSQPFSAPMPSAAFVDLEEYRRAPIGNGPFKVEGEWRGEDLVLNRNDAYWGDHPHIDALVACPREDLNELFETSWGGNLDLVSIPLGGMAAAVQQFGASLDGYTAYPGEQVLTGPGVALDALVFNCTDPCGGDVRFRKAVALAVDRAMLCSEIDPDYLRPADNVVPPGCEGYEPGAWDVECDVDAATDGLSSLFAELGMGADAPLSIVCHAGSQVLLANALADQLRRTGFEVEVRDLDWRDYTACLAGGFYQMAVARVVSDYPTVDGTLFPLFSSTSDKNVCRYSDARVDGDFVDACGTVGTQARVEAFMALNRSLASQGPLVPLCFGSVGLVVSDRVNDLFVDPTGSAAFAGCWLSA